MSFCSSFIRHAGTWEALESVMCDVIKIRLKRRDATRSGKGNHPLNIKTAVDWPILKIGLQNFKGSFYSIFFSLHPSFLDVFLMTSHMPLSCASDFKIITMTSKICRHHESKTFLRNWNCGLILHRNYLDNNCPPAPSN